MRKSLFVKCLAAVMLIIISVVVGIIFSNDPVSIFNRAQSESLLNSYIESLASRASEKRLTTFDKTVLRSGVFVGVNISRFKFPEASKLLDHYVNGDGRELELDATYFKDSAYLAAVVKEYGVGDHGPITLTQMQDWRLSLALNPYYLSINAATVRIYHPNISFEPAGSREAVFTIVPIGKLKLKVYDQLVSALNPKPFPVFSEWSVAN